LPVPNKQLRYYQEIAINRVIPAILSRQKRVLVNMATGTGKTDVAFQICWKLWSTRWNLTGEARRRRILFVSDRSILVDDPKAKQFAMPRGRSKAKLFTVAKCILRPIKQSQKTKAVPDCTKISAQSFSTSSSLTSAIAVARRAIAIGATSSPTLNLPFSLG
jgi:type I site-specific restriction endonuclease